MTLKWEKRCVSKWNRKDCGKKEEIENICLLTCVKHTMLKGGGGRTMWFNGGGGGAEYNVSCDSMYDQLCIINCYCSACCIKRK